MSTNPFTNNPNYKQLFSIRDYNKCDNVEIVELYERKIITPNIPKRSPSAVQSPTLRFFFFAWL